MKELIEYLARALASRPDEVVIEEEQRGDQIIFHLQCADEDKGRVIGRDGRVANAMRSLLHVASIRAGVRATLNIE
jgi:predicted RNA-binding protein YlqC (UPF0109 family)